MNAVRARLTYANVIATIALFLALGGSAYAVTAGKNTVTSKSIAKGAVKTADLANKAVSAKKLKPGAVPANAIANNSIGAAQLGNVVMRSASGTAPDGTTGAATAFCKPGEQVLSGSGQAGDIQAVPYQSEPVQPNGKDPADGAQAGGWVVIFYNPPTVGAPADSLKTWVLCLQ
jgi:hypothetical protein